MGRRFLHKFVVIKFPKPNEPVWYPCAISWYSFHVCSSVDGQPIEPDYVFTSMSTADKVRNEYILRYGGSSGLWLSYYEPVVVPFERFMSNYFNRQEADLRNSGLLPYVP